MNKRRCTAAAMIAVTTGLLGTACGGEPQFDERTLGAGLGGVADGGPPPVAGAPCDKLDEVRSKACGACGRAETLCLADSGGKLKWSDYSACTGELAGGCLPGTTVDEPCGNCGTLTKTCTKYCAYTSSACMGQPAESCRPGSVEYSTVGCDASSYRQRTCTQTCTWGNFSSTCAEPDNSNKLTVDGGVPLAR